MSFEIKEKLIEKHDAVQVTDRFRKRAFVFEFRENVGSSDFIETIKFQMTQDRCDMPDNVQMGEEIKINFNIKGGRWEKEGRVSYFNNPEAWKPEKIGVAQPGIPPAYTMDDMPPEPSDDLPFREIINTKNLFIPPNLSWIR